MYELSTGISCLIIILLSFVYGSFPGILLGVFTYTGIRLWTVWRQDAMTPHIRSAIRKLRNADRSDQAPEALDRRDMGDTG